jgi:hypothetical protein
MGGKSEIILKALQEGLINRLIIDQILATELRKDLGLENA